MDNAERNASTKEAVADLVAANRILYAEGVVDAFGHVSVRHPEKRDLFLIARSVAPNTVQAEDILEMNLDGGVVGPRQGKPYLERFIHTEIYRRFPDVQAVVHSHSHSVIPFGVTGVRLKPVFHMASFLGDAGAPVFDIRGSIKGVSDLLIRTADLGAALAQSFECGCAVLQRGHGSTVVARSLREVVFRAVYLEVNAKLQAQAMALGPITFLTEGEARLATAVNAEAAVSRAWDMWASRVGN
jgi:HCOMODA/2-hydroxy-3-carboxy-muconic semialdehyde decarboxylase